MCASPCPKHWYIPSISTLSLFSASSPHPLHIILFFWVLYAVLRATELKHQPKNSLPNYSKSVYKTLSPPAATKMPRPIRNHLSTNVYMGVLCLCVEQQMCKKLLLRIKSNYCIDQDSYGFLGVKFKHLRYLNQTFLDSWSQNSRNCYYKCINEK